MQVRPHLALTALEWLWCRAGARKWWQTIRVTNRPKQWLCRSSWMVKNLINQQRLSENPTNYISANPGCIRPAKITPKVPTSFSTLSYFCPFSTVSKIMERLGEIRPNKKNFAHFTHTKHELPQCTASTLQIDFTESKKIRISFNSIGRDPVWSK